MKLYIRTTTAATTFLYLKVLSILLPCQAADECSLCAENAIPRFPNATYSLTKKYCSEGQGNSADDFDDCAFIQLVAFLDCGCPDPPPLLEVKSCTLCSDGSDPSYPEAVAEHGHVTGATATCEKIQRAFPYTSKSMPYLPEHSEDSWACASEQYRLRDTCGCPAMLEPHREGCTLCIDGSQPRDADAMLPGFNVSCSDAYTSVPFLQSKYGAYSDGCEKTQEVAVAACGCPVIPSTAMGEKMKKLTGSGTKAATSIFFGFVLSAGFAVPLL
mmetsp:Transcript_31500/g.62417  ORF Transcript_31500/g.62417 Transcript_31500/m.62417 type:complete len:272 (+) Transcript_31500:230-1045(+)